MRNSFTIIAILLFLAWGCNVTKRLAPGEQLVTSNEVILEKEWPKKDKRNLGNDLEDIATPDPNDKILWVIPFKLWAYQKAEDTTTRFKKWVVKRLGERPALYDSIAAGQAASNMERYLFNKGYLNSAVEFDKKPNKSSKKKVSVHYRVKPRELAFFGNITYEIEDSVIAALVKEDSAITEKSHTAPFDMDVLLKERNRINEVLINNGYYRFSKQYVRFELDTARNATAIDAYIRILPPENQERHQQYHIRNVYIVPDFDETSKLKSYDTLNYQGIDILHKDLRYNPQSLTNGVFLREGELYKRSNYQLTINRLTNLRVFRFVNVELKPVKDSAQHALDVVVKLMPAKQREMSMNINATTSSYYFLGSEAGINYTNKNLFQYTDVFSLGLNGGVEANSDSARALYLNTVEFNANVDFYFPTMINPLGIKIDQKRYNPRTILSARYEYFRRVRYYTLNSTNFSYNYEWVQSARIRHVLTPLVINFVRVTDTTQAFSETVEQNPLLRQSFQDQLIIGSRYSFIYSTQSSNKPYFWYFRGNMDAAGNLLYASYQIADGSTTNGQPHAIFGRPFSQFIRPDLELRHYRNYSSDRVLASRFLVGVGIPFGNSSVLPYIKQFVIGGSNSIRAFRVRELGPGRTGSSSTAGFNDRTGDMKIEANVEYRFPIYDIFKGGIFVDAGNIWLLEDGENARSDKVFYFDRFYKDLGIGTGAGLRVDFSFFVLRLDLGIPVRVPYDNTDNGWRIKTFVNDFSPFNGPWRRDHLRLNLAIGYPF